MSSNTVPLTTIRLASHNAQGLNSAVKRRKLFQSYHAQKMAVVMIQETHFPSRYNPSFLHAQYPLFFLANAEDKTRGVAILFAKTCKFKPSLVHRDPEGRFILVKGMIDECLFSFISYYSPNKGQTKFFQAMFQTLSPLLEGTVIFGGDSNVAFDPGLDKSKPPATQPVRPTKTSSTIAKLIYQQGLADIWREHNKTKRDFTHYSNPHRTYSRIDHILISAIHIPCVLKAYIKDTALSDHSMVVISLQSRFHRPPTTHWRLNEILLTDPISVTEIERELKEYFLRNNVEGISAETLWAAHKATIRGKLIQMSSQRKKGKIAEIEKLERDFSALCKQHKRDPSKVQIAQLDAARIALNLAHTVGAERSLNWNNAKFYFQRDKMSTLLARKLSPTFSNSTLPKIRMQDGSTTLNPQKTLQAFHLSILNYIRKMTLWKNLP